MCLLLGATGVGKTLLLKRLQNILHQLFTLTLDRMHAVLPERVLNVVSHLQSGTVWAAGDIKTFVVDCANIVQISSSCVQLLSVLSAEPLHSAAVLILFNKRDLPCTMSLVELKSLFRMDEIIRTAPQSITTLEISARSGQGLQDVLSWMFSNHSHDT
uniref:ADP-ribosylation factor-like 16 n=1 Tax=Cyprinus carpio TaxID=7962 RepID=A0A8C1RUK5_CYPCA